MLKNRTQNDIFFDDSKLIKVTEMGNITELLYMSRKNTKATIKMLPGGNEYIDLSTGDVKEVSHHTTRAEQYKSLARTFRNMRNIINANITDVSRVRWITLTYAENMRDTKRLYKDFELFNKRFQYYIQNKLNLNKAEYIVVAEPQGRGAWHLHLLYIFDTVAPYIDNDTVLYPMWSHGWTKCQKLKDVDNIGAYLTAYLGDIPLDELGSDLNKLFEFLHTKCPDSEELNMNLGKIKEIEIKDDFGNLKKKQFIKGGRLIYYPANFNMFRCSRGIKRPIEHELTYKKARRLVVGQKVTFEKTTVLKDASTGFESIINKRHYNKTLSRFHKKAANLDNIPF